MRVIRKVLCANRGEIAVRVFRTCRRMGIATVAVFSEADRDALHVREADEAVCVGAAPSSESYLNMDAILDAARRTGADAVHPGYGFLSENPEFARRCTASGLVFVGPLPESMEMVGNKQAVKLRLQAEARDSKQPRVPLIPGYAGEDQSVERLTREALAMGFPVLVKAAAGGGGKGMRVVRDGNEVEAAVSSVKSEAKNAFGDDAVLLEKYFDACRHVEIQIVGDEHGSVAHLGERDCSVQRRYQKVIEETPCPGQVMTPDLRRRMGEAAVEIGRLSRYVGAGTVEFLVDERTGEFFFLEVNTRLQVEHPITEIVNGVDLVRVQLEVAQGRTLEEIGLLRGKRKDTPSFAMECRLYAEDPSNNFFPCTGTLTAFRPHYMEGLRYDASVEEKSEISVHYDPMIAKVIAYGHSRAQVLQRMRYALSRTVVLGLTTNKEFLMAILSHELFERGDYSTSFIAQHMTEETTAAAALQEGRTLAAMAATVWDWSRRQARRRTMRHIQSGWGNGLRKWPSTTWIHSQSEQDKVAYRFHPSRQTRKLQVCIGGEDGGDDKDAQQRFHVDIVSCDLATGDVRLEVDGVVRSFVVVVEGASARMTSGVGDEDELVVHVHSDEFGARRLQRVSRFGTAVDAAGGEGSRRVVCPVPAKVLEVLVSAGDHVKVGQHVATVESMKMSMRLNTAAEGLVDEVAVKPGDVIPAKTTIVVLSN